MPSTSWSDNRLPTILLILTAVTGVVDAVSFLGLGRVFTANMTGNVVFLAFAVGGAPSLSIPRSTTALAAFLAGAVVGGRMTVRMSPAGQARRASIAFGIEAALLAVATAVATRVSSANAQESTSLYAVIILTAIAMGIRNAVVRKLGVPDLTTTVLTLTITGLASDSSLAGGSNPRWQRRVASIALMFGGAAVGTLLLRHTLALPLAFAAFSSFSGALMVYGGRQPSGSEMLAKQGGTK